MLTLDAIQSRWEELPEHCKAFVRQQLYATNTFQPREDSPEEYDEQTAFVESRDRVSFAVGGTGSGKTHCAALKVANFLLRDQPPPHKDTPYWVISDTYQQVQQVCWFEKMRGKGNESDALIPYEAVEWDKCIWANRNRQWPYSITLKPWPGHPDRNWVLEFKSYEQGRNRMQAVAIGGFWFSEQFPGGVFEEVFARCRENLFPGGQVCDFTPVDPAKSIEVEQWYNEWTEGKRPSWGFYRMNTEKNDTLDPEWFKTFYESVSEEMYETRMIGAFAGYEGLIYQTFNPVVHLVSNVEVPRGVHHRRAIDWGASASHPFVCLFAYKDAHGRWVFYDEYYDKRQVGADVHAEAIFDRHPWPNDHYHGATYADPSRPDNIELFTRSGIPITPAYNSVYPGIEAVRVALKTNPGTGEAGILIDKERCPNLARQFRTYRWLKGSDKGLNPAAPRPEPLKNDDDCMDALRYLIASENMSVSKPATGLDVRWKPKTGTRFETKNGRTPSHGVPFVRGGRG